MRKVGRVFLCGVPFGILLCVGYWKYSLSEGNLDSHRIRKRQTDAGAHFEEEEGVEDDTRIRNPVVKDVNNMIDFKEHLPGYLVCQKKKSTAPATLMAGLEMPPEDVGERLRDESNKIRIKVSMSSLNPRRPVGCCPAGNETGQMYRVGYSCCIDQVYDKNLKFCCLDKRIVLEKNDENKAYCYPKDGNPFCRESDLKIAVKAPMVLKCAYNERKSPTFCNFVCPSGTVQTKGVLNATCSGKGVWNSAPTCCEGCPSTLQLDLWFLIEVSQNYGKEDFRHLMKFLKDSLSYLPVSQDRVRVGVTIFNRVVFYDVGVWYMNEHNSHESIFRAIDEIPMEGNGVKTGSAIKWVAKNAFTDADTANETKGNREDVENLVVAILHGVPEDPFVEPARALKSISKVLTIGIGNEITDDDLNVIASSPDNVYRSEDFWSLNEIDKFLYKSTCGKSCNLPTER